MDLNGCHRTSGHVSGQVEINQSAQTRSVDMSVDGWISSNRQPRSVDMSVDGWTSTNRHVWTQPWSVDVSVDGWTSTNRYTWTEKGPVDMSVDITDDNIGGLNNYGQRTRTVKTQRTFQDSTETCGQRQFIKNKKLQDIFLCLGKT